jgi:CBS domain-containing protein
MPSDELAGLAAGASVVEFPAGATIADYTNRVPDDVWMVYSGQVTLRAGGDGAVIDTVGRGGIFGYTPLLTGGGMEFDARAAVPSTLIRLPGAPVRAQFARPAGLAFLASSAWNTSGERPAIAPAVDNRAVGELVHGDVLVVPPATSVRDAVVQMTAHHVSYALIRLPDGEFGIFTDRDLRSRVVAAGLTVDVPISEVMSAPVRTVTATGLPAAPRDRLGRRRSRTGPRRPAGDRGRRGPVPQRHQGVGHQRDPLGGDRQPGPQGARTGAGGDARRA